MPSPDTQWQGENINRYCDPAYDALVVSMSQSTDPAERAALAIQMNDMLTKDSNVIIPLIHRGTVSARALSLGGVKLNAWDTELWNIADWYRMGE